MEKWHGFLAVVHLLWPENRVFNQLQTSAYLFQGLEVPLSVLTTFYKNWIVHKLSITTFVFVVLDISEYR